MYLNVVFSLPHKKEKGCGSDTVKVDSSDKIPLLREMPNGVRNEMVFFSCKKMIYFSMKIIIPVRAIKGQEVLTDGSILEDHQITDGSTINIIIEPAKEINLHILMSPMQIIYGVNNSMFTCDLKQLLVDSGVVAWALDEFQLLISSDFDDVDDDNENDADDHDNDGDDDDDDDEIPSAVPLHNELLPLHLCGVGDKTRLKIVGRNITIHLMGQNGQCWHKTLSRNMKIREMKQVIHSFEWLFHSGETSVKFRAGVILFLETGNGYLKLEGEAQIGSVLSDNDALLGILDKNMSLF